MTQSIVSTSEWHSELRGRQEAVWEISQREACDFVLIYGSDGHAEPFRYLTNFVPALGETWLLMHGGGVSCVMNFDWQVVEAQRASGIHDWYGAFQPLPLLIDQLTSANPRQIGVVGFERMPVTTFNALADALPMASFKDIGDAVARLRRRKSPLEIKLLREAGRITDLAFDAMRGELKPGLTEHEVAARVAYHMGRLGAGLSFPPTVVSGNDDPIMIRMPTERKLEVGDSVMFDIGAEYQGYQADASRTFVLGKPSADQRAVWSVVTEAYKAALEQVRPGNPCNATQIAGEKVINDAGYELIHRIGHGIGLATSFEWPSLITETAPFEPGVAICLEPGIYVKGTGNMKLEDDLVVTEDGYELLTNSSRELTID